MHELTEDELLEFSELTIQELSRQYLQIVGQIAINLNISRSSVMISELSMTLAFSEATKDLRIMAIRRGSRRGISSSKIAGIVAFRLARFSPIHLSYDALENDVALKINELAALTLALKSIMHVNLKVIKTEYVTRELQYCLVRRHMNQETLGLAFEILKGHT